mmetsp:Transcript_26745/g.55047  ORF Transcript_26745/g.55047 Transcript_26745/m.55047 type:complete len:116 (-) Transcript_26745:156-503(-)
MGKLTPAQKRSRDASKKALAARKKVAALKAAAVEAVEKRINEHDARMVQIAEKGQLSHSDFTFTQCKCAACTADGAGSDSNITKALLKLEPLKSKAGKLIELALHGKPAPEGSTK